VGNMWRVDQCKDDIIKDSQNESLQCLIIQDDGTIYLGTEMIKACKQCSQEYFRCLP
jgi:hypothetical protein